jgi:N-acetylmuramoyl-L-alanine amidase
MKRIFKSLARISGSSLALAIQKNLVAELKRNNRGIVDRGDLAVLNSTYMPAALAEILFMSNQEEIGLINQENVRQRTAEAMAKAVNEYFGFSN